MPFMAKIKRGDPFCSADQREIYAMCRRIAGAAECCSSAGWREESGYLLYHFTTWAKARAMQHWIDRSGIAHRPMPKLGPTPEEEAERKRQALAWGLATGAVRDIVQAYRRARHAGDQGLTSFNAACAVGLALGRPNDEVRNTVEGPARMGEGKSPGMVLSLRAAGSACPRDASSCPGRKPAGPRCGAASAPAFADLLGGGKPQRIVSRARTPLSASRVKTGAI